MNRRDVLKAAACVVLMPVPGKLKLALPQGINWGGKRDMGYWTASDVKGELIYREPGFDEQGPGWKTEWRVKFVNHRPMCQPQHVGGITGLPNCYLRPTEPWRWCDTGEVV